MNVQPSAPSSDPFAGLSDGTGFQETADGLYIPPTPNRFRSKGFIALVVLGVSALAAALVFGVFYLLDVERKKTPEYSMEQLAIGLRTQDSIVVSSHLDVDGVVDDLYKAASEDVAADLVGDEYGWLAAAVADFAAPAVSDALSAQVDDSLMSGNGDALAEALESDSVEISRSDSIATARVPLDDSYVEFELQLNEDRWRISGVRNAEDVYLELFRLLGVQMPDLAGME